MKQIFLEKNKSKKSSNVDNFINMELSTESRLLPVSDVDEKVNAYEEYISEKDASNKHRLIFTINPVCSNILFNAYSEIVYHEGADDCFVIKDSKAAIPSTLSATTNYLNYKSCTNTVAKKDFIRDTAFSDASMGFVYHCGADIFNNHALRKKNFTVVNKLASGLTTYTLRRDFNTLSDYLRDSNGNIIKEKILKATNGYRLNNTILNLHLYQVDTVNTYKKTVNDKLIESDGWVGFINPTSLNIPNYVSGETAITINKCMNNNKAGEQIDMYPDRSLYSFIPKYNKYRNRMENNWDYCITYPYSSYTSNSLVQYQNLNVEGSNGIHCESIDNISLEDTILSGILTGKTENQLLYFRTQIKNTFTTGSFINITIFNTKNSGVYANSYSSIKIEGVGYMGNDTNHIFAIKLMDIYPLLSMVGEVFLDEEGHLLKTYEIRVRKNIKGADCKYYIRKFRRVPNFKGTDVYQDGIISEDEINKYSATTFNNSLNKLAYGENIFSDKMVQIVFNDDINTTGLRDNLGRELSEIYLTIIKRNKGYFKWYNGTFKDSDIEFSHCFGPIDAGFDLSTEEDSYNVHKINNITSTTKVSSDITIDSKDFDGDIVEFSPYDIEETVLECAQHRFNTYQREKIYSIFGSGILYDEIQYDDYDIGSSFYVNTANTLNDNLKIHLNPEGYYYQAHYRIPILEFNTTVNQGSHTRMAINNIGKKGNNFTGITAVNYFLNVGDKIYLYEKFTHKKYEGEIKGISGKTFSEIEFNVENIGNISNYMIYKINPLMPDGAYDLNDGTGRYLWRDKKSAEDMLPGDELYEDIFTNGTHYHHQNINFFLRRQDPTGEYGLNEKCPLDNFTGAAEGKIKDISEVEYIEENQGTIC